MNADYANPFIKSAVRVFEKELDIKLSRKELLLKPGVIPSFNLSIIIGVTGLIKGQVVYSLDSNFAMHIAKKMLPGKNQETLRMLVNSAVSELANIITGQASIELAGENRIIEITPPAVINGKDFNIDFLNIPTISLSFISEVGSFEINIALTEK